MKILVAEDDADQLSLRCMVLAQSGFESIGAADAGSAAALAATHRPECAVVDLRLPTEEIGLGLIRDLKRLDPAMHVLVLTGGDACRLANIPENQLIDGIVTKGSSSSVLIRLLNALAAAPHAARS
jgi:two-component system, response regulator RegA